MTLNEYQERAMETKMSTCDNFSYMMLNLVGEVGEFASKVAKAIRKKEGYVEDNDLILCQEHFPLLKAEAGDILWQLAGLCDAMGWDLDDVAQQNLEKLASRKQRGVIDGNGDER